MFSVETYITIEGGAKRFYDVFLNMPHHIPGMMSSQNHGKLTSVDLHADENYSGGKVGTLLSWHYVLLDGKARVAETRIGAIDRENNSMTWEVVGGDLVDYYKRFNFILHVTLQNGQRGSSMAHWILEYEKHDESVPEPHALLQLVVAVNKDIDAHLSTTT